MREVEIADDEAKSLEGASWPTLGDLNSNRPQTAPLICIHQILASSYSGRRCEQNRRLNFIFRFHRLLALAWRASSHAACLCLETETHLCKYHFCRLPNSRSPSFDFFRIAISGALALPRRLATRLLRNSEAANRFQNLRRLWCAWISAGGKWPSFARGDTIRRNNLRVN